MMSAIDVTILSFDPPRTAALVRGGTLLWVDRWTKNGALKRDWANWTKTVVCKAKADGAQVCYIEQQFQGPMQMLVGKIMMVVMLFSEMEIVEIPIHKWRRLVYRRSKVSANESKSLALITAQRLGMLTRSHDEAEAYLIGYAGCIDYIKHCR